MFERLGFAHSLLWRGDRWYRRAWYAGPQILAVVVAVWLLVSGAPGAGTPAAPPSTAGWAAPVSDADLGSAADALRNQAETSPDAFATLKAQADAGNPYMQFAIATLYDPTINIPRTITPNIDTAEAYYRTASWQGHPYAALNLGGILTFGLGGTAPDTKQGIGLLMQAANQNVAPAQFLMGRVLREGVGGPKDETLALQWFQKAAKQNYAGAEAVIGQAYWDGEAPYPKDPATAVKWLLAGARDPTQTLAARILGIAYRDNNGAPKDEGEALKWFTQAAQNGDTFSAAEVGFAYWNGTPPYTADAVEAVKWLNMAAVSPAETGAQIDLGIAYRDERGVMRDPTQARYWFQQAATHGDPTAAQYLKTLPP